MKKIPQIVSVADIKTLQEKKDVDNTFNSIVSICCYYALRDITQEINTVLKLLSCMSDKPAVFAEELSHIVSGEDLQLWVNWLERHGNNLLDTAKIMKRSMMKHNLCDCDKEKLIAKAAEWDKFGNTYHTTHETIIDRYLSLLEQKDKDTVNETR